MLSGLAVIDGKKNPNISRPIARERVESCPSLASAKS
jgi:hypothetical protein